MSQVRAWCEGCHHAIEVPRAVLEVTWNCPACGKHNVAPVGSGTYQNKWRRR